MGVVIRDSLGKFVAATTKKIPERTEAHRVESTTVMEGLKFAWGLGIISLTLDGDAQVTLESFEHSEKDLLLHATIILQEAFGIASRFHFF